MYIYTTYIPIGTLFIQVLPSVARTPTSCQVAISRPDWVSIALRCGVSGEQKPMEFWDILGYLKSGNQNVGSEKIVYLGRTMPRPSLGKYENGDKAKRFMGRFCPLDCCLYRLQNDTERCRGNVRKSVLSIPCLSPKPCHSHIAIAIYLSVCLLTYLPTYLPLSTYLSTYLPTYLSI